MIPLASIRFSNLAVSKPTSITSSKSSIAHQTSARTLCTNNVLNRRVTKTNHTSFDVFAKRNHQRLFPVGVSSKNHIVSSKCSSNIKSVRFIHGDSAGSSLPGSHLNKMHGTTVLCVKKNGKVVLIADGQVTFGETRLKSNARKLRRLGTDGKIAAGFAGSTADALTLFERLEDKLQEYPGQLLRSCIALAKSWRTDKYLRQLDAIMIVSNKDNLLTLSGSGDVLEHSDVVAIGSGGNYALAAAKALYDLPDLDAEQIAQRAMKIAADICIYTNDNFTVEILGGTDTTAQPAPLQTSEPGPATPPEEKKPETTPEAEPVKKVEDEISS